MTAPKLTIHTHTDLIEILPLFAGYQPTDSLVVLFITGDGRADKAARIDLSLDPAHLNHILITISQQAAHLATDRGPGSIHAVAYSDDTHTADHTLIFLADNWPTQESANHLETDPDQAVLGMLATASQNSWAAIDPHQPDLPAHRQPYPSGTSVLAAEAAYAGAIREHDTRDQLAATITRPAPDTASHFAALIDQTNQNANTLVGVEAMTAWMENWITDGYPAVDEPQAAQLVAAVQHIDTRDTAWMHISTADARHHLNLWRSIACQVDGPQSLAVLGLVGMAAWISGNGTLVNITLDRAHTIPEARDYTLLGLLEQIITAGLPPAAWTNIRTDLANQLHNRS